MSSVTRNGKALKQPWYIWPTEENTYFAMAGLLAKWVASDGSNHITACVITTEPNGVITPIHDRMPVILSGSDIETWLNPGNHDRNVLIPMLKSVADETMKAIPVSLSVNRAGNEGPELIQAIELPE
jgi:putative SOS response-associated peptidase YedK